MDADAALTALDELKLYREAHRTSPHRVRITSQAMTNVLDAAFRAIADKDAELGQMKTDLKELARALKALEFTRSEHLVASRDLADAHARIARLQAELDDVRDVPVEYAPTAGIEAAMAADPHRIDGTLLRETGGDRRAWAWKAAAMEWEQVG